ncbi:MAG: 4Fe-4S dicluster domain-containing protein [Promethearchaeota archaeon]
MSSANKDRTVHKEMDVDETGSKIIEKWRFLDTEKIMTYDINKCVGCSLCYVVCPERAIEIGPVPEIAQGLIEDMPPVLIDTEKCSFCFMCERVCINSVYDIRYGDGSEIDKSAYPKLPQLWKYHEETCQVDENSEICKMCIKIRDPENVRNGKHFAKDLAKVVKNCPTKSMEFVSPFKGKVTILPNQLHKCDPNGCKACVNICPTESFFIPQTAEDIIKYGKIACNEETCMYCGACENACPEKIIVVQRDSVDMEIPEESLGKPWLNRWKEQFSNLTLSRVELENKIREEQDIIHISEEEIEPDEIYKKISPELPLDPQKEKAKTEKMKPVDEVIEKSFDFANVRYFIHLKKKDKLKKYLRKKLDPVLDKK